MAKWPVDRSPRRKVSAKYVAVAWILFLELVVATYVYTNASGPNELTYTSTTATSATGTSTVVTTTTTTSTSAIADKISVLAASIANGTLSLSVKNSGPSATTLMTLLSLCTPKFQTCYSYAKDAGKAATYTFVLPARKTFSDNLTGVCVMPIPGCKAYLPLANSTYYYQVQFTFSDGSNVVVPVKAEASTTWAPDTTAVLGVSPPVVDVYGANLTGILNFTVTANASLPYASWTSTLDGFMKPKSVFSGPVLTNSTGCEGSAAGNFTLPKGALNYTGQCSGPVSVIVPFFTVTTGISAKAYFALVIKDTTSIKAKGQDYWPNVNSHAAFYFVTWVQSTAAK